MKNAEAIVHNIMGGGGGAKNAFSQRLFDFFFIEVVFSKEEVPCLGGEGVVEKASEMTFGEEVCVVGLEKRGDLMNASLLVVDYSYSSYIRSLKSENDSQ